MRKCTCSLCLGHVCVCVCVCACVCACLCVHVRMSACVCVWYRHGDVTEEAVHCVLGLFQSPAVDFTIAELHGHRVPLALVE